MTYAATPAAQPLTEAPAPAEEGKAPPTIDSHGGKLTPLSHCYPDAATSLLLMLALLSTLSPRQILGVNLSWTRLAPGLLICTLVIWNMFPTEPAVSYPGMADYFRVRSLHLGALLAFAVLNLIADVLTPAKETSPARGLTAMFVSALGLVLLLGLTLVDWYARTPVFSPSVDLAGGLVWVAGVPAGIGLALLWRRLHGWLFDVLFLAIAAGSLFLAGQFVLGFDTALIGFQLAACTVAASAGTSLRAIGRPDWQALTGRAAWIWAWILRCAIIAMGVC